MRTLGCGSWYADDYKVIGQLRWGSYGTRYLDGWVVKAIR